MLFDLLGHVRHGGVGHLHSASVHQESTSLRNLALMLVDMDYEKGGLNYIILFFHGAAVLQLWNFPSYIA